MRLFMDFKPGGALCIILSRMYRFKTDQRMRKFDFTVGKVIEDRRVSNSPEYIFSLF